MLVQELYNEVFAVELLLQQTLLVITDHELRNKMIRGIRWGEGGGARRGGGHKLRNTMVRGIRYVHDWISGGY